MKCIYRHISQWMDEREKEINGEKSARLEEGPTAKFTSRPAIWNFFQRQLSLWGWGWGGEGRGGREREGVDTVKLLSLKLRSRQRVTFFFVVRTGSRHNTYSQTSLSPLKSCPLNNIGKIQERRKISRKCRSFGTLSWPLESCCDLDSMTPWGRGSREKGRRQNSSIKLQPREFSFQNTQRRKMNCKA